MFHSVYSYFVCTGFILAFFLPYIIGQIYNAVRRRGHRKRLQAAGKVIEWNEEWFRNHANDGYVIINLTDQNFHGLRLWWMSGDPEEELMSPYHWSRTALLILPQTLSERHIKSIGLRISYIHKHIY